jgi:MoaA/NifB/PqqE/SkfB family radical SAM enzyme
LVPAIQKAYFHYRIIRMSFLHDRKPFACSLAPTLACNLTCSFCYTASPRALAKGQKTRQLQQELTVDAFKELCLTLRKRGIRHATLTDGEPLLTEKSREKCKVAAEIFDQTWIVTNGTFGFSRFRNTLYIVSLDGDEETHDHIRGKGVFAKIKQNISSGGISTDCYCNTTLTRLNHAKIQNIIEAAKKLGANGICFAWSTPMSPKDMLYLSHEERQKDIEEIQRLKQLFYADYILNSDTELNLMRTNTWSNRCPTWFVESYDAYGNRKPTCVFGKATSFMCENCGCNIYPSILTILERRKAALISKLAFKTG